MSSRDTILKTIRAISVPERELPSLDSDWIQFDSPIDQFATMLEAVGGRSIRVKSISAIESELSQLDQFQTAKIKVSTIDGIGEPTLDLLSVQEPFELETVDFAVLRGEFAVAENGAVWVREQSDWHRAIYFITQHLALVVPTSEIVNNMHEAYARLSFTENQFAGFISGPSKTADIEQSLVIGAQGPRSHVVFLVDDLV
jgi:L-lactate dehydrogenase complex protein LldG